MKEILVIIITALLFGSSEPATAVPTPLDNAIETSPTTEEMPWEITYERPKPLDSPTYIDGALIDVLQEALNANQFGFLEEITSDRLLTVAELAEKDLGVEKDALIHGLTTGGYAGYHEIMMVDADNDGIDDIVLYLHSGGSAGLVDIDFYKGDGDGSYKSTFSSGIGFYSENAFIQYEGKNYFLITAFDYNRKVRTGFEVYCFQDGVVVERASVQKLPDQYHLAQEKKVEAPYEALAQTIAKEINEIYDREKNIVGSAERQFTREEADEASEIRKRVQNDAILIYSSWFAADINNDHVDEVYSKSLFEPSNNHTVVHLQFDCYREWQPYHLRAKNELDLWANQQIPQVLWVERVGERNIVCVLSTLKVMDDDTKDNILIDCYDISEQSYETVIQLVFEPTYRMQTEIFTQGLNRDFIRSGASDIGKG